MEKLKSIIYHGGFISHCGNIVETESQLISSINLFPLIYRSPSNFHIIPHVTQFFIFLIGILFDSRPKHLAKAHLLEEIKESGAGEILNIHGLS